MAATKTSIPRARRLAAVAAFAGLCAVLVALIGISSAGARKAVILGKTKSTPPASCGNKKHPDRCSVVGRVTGFMAVAGGKKGPFNVRKDGKIVAWATDLETPFNSKKHPQRDFFGTLFENKEFGKKPTARLAVIKRKAKGKYKLLRQSKTMELARVPDGKNVFTLNEPLRVRKGQVVAITYPTWAANFTEYQISEANNQWRASRVKDNCEPKKNTDEAKLRFARKSHSHEKVGSTRNYKCYYRGGRILYWAYFVPNKKK